MGTGNGIQATKVDAKAASGDEVHRKWVAAAIKNQKHTKVRATEQLTEARHVLLGLQLCDNHKI